MARKDVEDLGDPSEAHPNSKPKMGQDQELNSENSSLLVSRENRGYLPEGSGQNPILDSGGTARHLVAIICTYGRMYRGT